MTKLLVGIIFIFFKTNLYFTDTTVVYYLTNLIGLLFVISGVLRISTNADKNLNSKKYIFVFLALGNIFYLVKNLFYLPVGFSGRGLDTYFLLGMDILLMTCTFVSIYSILTTLIEEYESPTLHKASAGALTSYLIAALLGFFGMNIWFSKVFIIIMFVFQILLVIAFYQYIKKKN